MFEMLARSGRRIPPDARASIIDPMADLVKHIGIRMGARSRGGILASTASMMRWIAFLPVRY